MKDKLKKLFKDKRIIFSAVLVFALLALAGTGLAIGQRLGYAGNVAQNYIATTAGGDSATTTEFIGDVLPNIDDQLDLGSPSKQWQHVYADEATFNSSTIGTLSVSSFATSPFVIGGSNTTTIYGDASTSTFGGPIRVFDSTGTDFLEFFHDGSNAMVDTNAGAIIFDSATRQFFFSPSDGGSARVLVRGASAASYASFELGETSTSDVIVKADHSIDQTGFFVSDNVGNQLVLGNRAFADNDFDHATPTNPTLFVHSDTDPDTVNDEWVGIAHNQTHSTFEAGSGGFIFTADQDPVADLHRSSAAAPSHQQFLLQDGTNDTVVQIASTNSGNEGSGILLTNQQSASDGRHWGIKHKGIGASNSFIIGYEVTAADGANILTGMDEFFSINTDGKVTISETGGDNLTLEHNGTNGILGVNTGSVVVSSTAAELNSGAGANGSALFSVKADTDNAVETAVAGMRFLNDGSATQGEISILGSTLATAAGTTITGGSNNALAIGGKDASVAGIQIFANAEVAATWNNNGELNMTPFDIGDGEASDGDGGVEITQTLNDTTTGDGTAGTYATHRVNITNTDSSAFQNTFAYAVGAVGSELWSVGLDGQTIISDATGALEIGMDGGGNADVFTTGSGDFRLGTGAGSTELQFGYDDGTFRPAFVVSSTASQVNYLAVTGAATGNDIEIEAFGSDANISIAFAAKGTSDLLFGNENDVLTIGDAGVTFIETASSTFTHATPTSDIPTNDMIFNAQDAFGAASVNLDGGDFVFNIATKTGAGNPGSFVINNSSGNTAAEITDNSASLLLQQFGNPFDFQVGDVNTANAATTTVATITTESDTSYTVYAKVTGTETVDHDETGSYIRVGSFKNDGGVLTQIGSTTALHTAEDTVAWNVVFEVSGTNILLRVIGAAATDINWVAGAEITTSS